MIDKTDLVSIEDRSRFHTGEEIPKFWTQERVFQAINAEVTRLIRIVVGLDVGFFEVQYTPAVAATIALPTNCYLVRNVELKMSGTWVAPTWINDHAKGQFQNVSGTAFPSAVRFFGNSIVFESGTGDATNCRITYVRMPAEMRYEAMAAGGTDSFTMGSTASVIDDVYVGDRIITMLGTSAGDIREISDYVGSTKVATISAAFTGTADTTTHYSTLLPEPLAKYPDLVARGAAMTMLGRRRDSEMYKFLADRYERDLEDMKNALTQRQTEQAQHGNYLPDGSE